jgi:transcriptional regulator with XRE-family HTH domain
MRVLGRDNTMIPQDENSYRKGFSVLLRRLRREEQGWKQKELAAKAGLKLRTIQDLETAQKAILDHDTVSKLAVAFGLGGAAQEEFFRAAGLAILNPSDDEVQWNIFIYEFHKSIQFPAFVSDDLANIQSLNSYIIELLQMDMEAFADLSCRFGRFNIMHFFLDPIFNAKKLYGSQWSYYTILNAWFLRNLSRPYVHSERYQK